MAIAPQKRFSTAKRTEALRLPFPKEADENASVSYRHNRIYSWLDLLNAGYKLSDFILYEPNIRKISEYTSPTPEKFRNTALQRCSATTAPSHRNPTSYASHRSIRTYHRKRTNVRRPCRAQPPLSSTLKQPPRPQLDPAPPGRQLRVR